MIAAIRTIKTLLNAGQRRQTVGVLVLTVASAFAEMVGIASILPFMAVLAAPETVQSNRGLRWVYDALGFQTTRHYLIFLGVVVLVLMVVSNIIKAWTRWATLNFSARTGHALSLRLFGQYLRQPYPFFLVHNSSELRKSVLGEVQNMVTNLILPVMDVVAKSLVCAAILILLIVIDPVLAVLSGAVLGGAYLVIYFFLRRWLLRLGQVTVAAQARRHKIVNEALQGIKNVKLAGQENLYAALYDQPAFDYARATTRSSVAGELPRYALEIIAFGGLLLILLLQMLRAAPLADTLPLMTLYAFAGYRLMPNFQALFTAFAKIRFNTPLLHKVSDELALTQQDEDRSRALTALPFRQSIALRDVCFAYDGAARNVLDTVNLTIAAGEIVGIVGKTGSGKTTLVDLITGLLPPSSGDILIDGVSLTLDNRRAWQMNTAYVTQHIYLADDSLRNNIAFGYPAPNDVRVMRAVKMAALDDLVAELPQGLDTVIGENGVRLSGGQRQRLGLARALYQDRPVLVLDEATSALDDATEQAVMDAIHALDADKTIIMIAHRAASLARAHRIVNLDRES